LQIREFVRTFQTIVQLPEPPISLSLSRQLTDSESPSAPRRGDTRERLLDAAERLFAERGFEGASMRALARIAGASLSSTNYHFGTKEALLEAVLRRRAGPLNLIRLERLENAERAAGDDAVPLAAILDAFVRPLFEVRAASNRRETRPAWVAARLFFDPAPLVSRFRSELLRDVDARFLAALERTLPQRERYEIEIAYQLTNGLLVHFAAGHVAPSDSDREQDGTNDAVLRGLIAYAGAGLGSLEEGAI
jgi:AcrR family transcriptional regulator